jgi:hypothetical protein
VSSRLQLSAELMYVMSLSVFCGSMFWFILQNRVNKRHDLFALHRNCVLVESLRSQLRASVLVS